MDVEDTTEVTALQALQNKLAGLSARHKKVAILSPTIWITDIWIYSKVPAEKKQYSTDIKRLIQEGHDLDKWVQFLDTRRDGGSEGVAKPCTLQDLADLYTQATESVPLDPNRRRDLYAQIWLEHARLQAKTGVRTYVNWGGH